MQGVFENRTNQYFRLFLITSSIIAVMVTLLSAAYFLFMKRQQKVICSTKKSASIISIRDACQKVTKKKPLLLIPIISAALQILALYSSLSASISLTTGKAPQFRVVDSCHEELCVSNDTKTFFQEGDLCSPEEFRWAENTSIWHKKIVKFCQRQKFVSSKLSFTLCSRECTGCPEADCLFHSLTFDGSSQKQNRLSKK